MRVRPRPSIRARHAVLLVAGLCLGAAWVGGCRSTEEWTYDKPRVTAAQLDRDLTQCGQRARPTGVFAYPAMTGPDREALNACMQKRGYTVIRRPAE